MNLQEQAQEAYDLVKATVDKIFENGEENQQWALNWIDLVNKQTIRF